MGFYYGPSSSDRQEPEEKPPGCMDVLVITRVVFGLLLWPMVALLGVMLVLAAVLWAFTVHPLLALVPLALTGVAVWLFARWEQRHFRPPDA